MGPPPRNDCCVIRESATVLESMSLVRDGPGARRAMNRILDLAARNLTSAGKTARQAG
jgi:hypothetical protein